MIVMPSLPGGYVVFCDDVRYEISGKQTYVGVYGTHLLIESFPALLQKLHCVITYRESMAWHGDVSIKIFHTVDDEDTVLTQIEFPVPPAEHIENDAGQLFLMREMKFNAEIALLNVDRPSSLRVRAFRDGQEIRLGALMIDVLQQVDADAAHSDIGAGLE
jgi:hypothetical protein